MAAFDREALIQRTLRGLDRLQGAQQDLDQELEERATKRRETIAQHVLKNIDTELSNIQDNVGKAADEGRATYEYSWWVIKCYEEGFGESRRVLHVPEEEFSLEEGKARAMRDAVLNAVVEAGLSAIIRNPKPVQISHVYGLMDPVEEWYDSKVGYGVEISWLAETPAEPAK